jgi:ATP-binding cassette subfamily F protein 3
LDEPTNHLDLEGIRWFESFVQNFKGSILMISHDRAFLDNTVDLIFELDEKEILTFPGNYTEYKQLKEGWIEQRAIAFKKQEQKRKTLENLIDSARQIKAGKKRGKAVRAAKKRLDREVLATEKSAYSRYEVTDLMIGGSTHSGKLVLTVDDLQMQFGNKDIFKDLSFEIRGNQRVWLYGQNGAGKSTLLNILTNKLTPTSGESRMGVNLTWGYFQQNQEHLPKDMLVGDYIQQQMGLSEIKQYAFLTRFGFLSEYIRRPLGMLSPGERARLSFGIFTLQEYDFLILDEPTNHLDIWTKEKIEEALQSFKGALLLVSHDRYFVENVGVDRVMNLDKGQLLFT